MGNEEIQGIQYFGHFEQMEFSNEKSRKITVGLSKN